MADTPELADGTIIEGDFVGSSNGIVMFNTADSVEAFPESQVVGIYLSEGVATSQALAAAPVPPAVTAPAGTRHDQPPEPACSDDGYRVQLGGNMLYETTTLASSTLGGALATRYLKEGDYSQAQIAFMIGFAYQGNFARAFKL